MPTVDNEQESVGDGTRDVAANSRPASFKFVRAVTAAIEQDQASRGLKNRLARLDRAYATALLAGVEEPAPARSEALNEIRNERIEAQLDVKEIETRRRQAFSSLCRAAQAEMNEPAMDLNENSTRVPITFFEQLQKVLHGQAALQVQQNTLKEHRRKLVAVGKEMRYEITNRSRTETEGLRKQRRKHLRRANRAKDDLEIHVKAQQEREALLMDLVRLPFAQQGIYRPRRTQVDAVSRGSQHESLSAEELTKQRQSLAAEHKMLRQAYSDAERLLRRCESRQQRLWLRYDRELVLFLEQDKARTASHFDRQYTQDRFRATREIGMAQEHLRQLKCMLRNADVLALSEISSQLGSVSGDGYVESMGSRCADDYRIRRHLDHRRIEEWREHVPGSEGFPLAEGTGPVPAGHGLTSLNSVILGDSECLSNKFGTVSDGPDLERRRRKIREWRAECDRFRAMLPYDLGLAGDVDEGSESDRSDICCC